MSDLREVGTSLGFETWSADKDSLLVRLNQLLPGTTGVEVEEAIARQRDDVFFTVAHVKYRGTSGEGTGPLIRETIVLLELPGLTFPQFTVQPRSFGTWLLEQAARLTGVQELDFPNHAEYDKVYSTFTFQPEPVRELLNDEVLSYLLEHPGLRIHALDDRVLVARPRKLLSGDELLLLISDAQGILSLLTQSAQRLHERGWDATQAARQTADEMGGLVGRLLRGRLVTREEVHEFVHTPPPRMIPSNVRKSYLSMARDLMTAVSIMLILDVIALVIVTTLAVQQVLPLPVAVTVLAVGMLLSIGLGVGFYFAVRYYRRQTRLLSRGRLVMGRILSVTATSVSINDQQRFHVEMEYDIDQQPQRRRFNAYGKSVQLAQSLLQSGATTELLVDPDTPESAVWSGLLVNWGT